MKKAILTAGVLASAILANAQHICTTEEIYRERKAMNPEIEVQEARLKADIEKAMTGRVNSAYAKTTAAEDDLDWAADTRELHIPVVVHIIYDYAQSEANTPSNNVSDAQVEAAVAQLTNYYQQRALNLQNIITPWKPYVGNAHISFHLATKDPSGKPTRGIVRNYSYFASKGDESAKINPWAPDKYLNIYLIYTIGRGASNGIVLAYATFPTSYSDNPYSQGVISRADQASSTLSSTLAHEVGHYLFLYHPWSSNNAEVEKGPCGDDEVDDTPPTIGHFSCGPAKLYDDSCAKGYYRDYDSATYRKITATSIRTILAPDSIGSKFTYTKTRLYNDSLGMILGQTFTTDNRLAVLQDISVYVDTNATTKGGFTRMSLYDATGTTLIARSATRAIAFPGAKLTYSFVGTTLAANTMYKFVIDTGGTHLSFNVRTSDSNWYSRGTMFAGANAATPITGSDLQFEVKQIRRIDYPDTTNTQNIMDYSDCNAQMFTRGQVARMRAALRSDVGFRSNLISNKNLAQTGIWDTLNNVAIPLPDITPTALYSVNRFFVCADGTTPITFTNRSYNDTLSGASWTFSNNASPANSTSSSFVNVTFNNEGWVSSSLTATGTGTGSDTRSDSALVYAADPNAISPIGYVQDFNPGGDMAKYPLFNYYKLPDNKWEFFSNAGVYDQTSVRFRNFDTRASATIGNATASPGGSYSDMITRAFDLSQLSGGNCNLTFFSAGAFRTNRPSQMTDTLEISMSNDCGQNWRPVSKVFGGDLGNNALVETPFVPNAITNWKEQAFNVPSAFRTEKVYFRFRFRPGTNMASSTGFAYGTGNHFYMDRLRISDAPLGVENGIIVSLGMTVSPNPTSGAATISINGGDNSTADISVTDVTGKLVFSSSVKRSATNTRIEIPAEAIAVKGMYLVKVVTNGATETKKLVVY